MKMRDLELGLCFDLKYSFEVGHFRAVCTSWRCAVPPPPRNRLTMVSKYPPPGKESDAAFLASKLIRRLVFRLQLGEIPLSSSSSSPTSYLIAVEEHYDGDGQTKLRLLNPITGTPIPVSSNLFPREINLNKFRVSILHESSFSDLLYKKLKIRRFSTARKATVVLRGGKLSLRTGGRVIILNDLMDSRHRHHNLDKPIYQDVVKYKEKWFAIDQYRRGVMVDSSSKVVLVTNPLFLPDTSTGYCCHCTASLVKSPGDADLFLLVRYCYDDSEGEGTVRFNVYKLEEKQQCWKQVKSLNNQVIFAGDIGSLWSYCVSVKDFPECRGNFIYFTEEFKKPMDGDLPDFCDALKHERKYYIGGFHMENRMSGPLSCFPGCTDFFWPPPA